MAPSLNHESSIEDLRILGPQFKWSGVLHMIENVNLSEDLKIEMIRYLLETGFHVSNVFAHLPDEG